MRIGLTLLAVLLAWSRAEAAAPTVAVLGVDFAGSEGARVALTESLTAGLRLARFDVLEPDEAWRKLRADPAALGCRSPSCWPRVARDLGASYLVVAATREVERSWAITLTLVRASGTVAVEVRERCELCGVQEAAERMSLAAGALRARLEALVAGPDVIARPLERAAAPAVAPPPEAPRRPAQQLLVYGKAGGLFPASGLEPGFSVQAGGGWVAPVLGGRLAAVLDLAYGQTGAAAAASDPRLGSGGATDYRRTLAARELLVFAGPQLALRDPGRRLVPYVALGLGLHVLFFTVDGTVAGAAFGENRQTAVTAGVVGRGGAGYRVGPGMLVGEVGLSWAPLSGDLTGPSQLGRVTLGVGYLAAFGLRP
jgi:hypothetical protein